jgi:hypothetical protein
VPPQAIGQADRLIPPGSCAASDLVSMLLLANRFNSTQPGCAVIDDGRGSDLALSGGRTPYSAAGAVPAVAALWHASFKHAGSVAVPLLRPPRRGISRPVAVPAPALHAHLRRPPRRPVVPENPKSRHALQLTLSPEPGVRATGRNRWHTCPLAPANDRVRLDTVVYRRDRLFEAIGVALFTALAVVLLPGRALCGSSGALATSCQAALARGLPCRCAPADARDGKQGRRGGEQVDETDGAGECREP